MTSTGAAVDNGAAINSCKITPDKVQRRGRRRGRARQRAGGRQQQQQQQKQQAQQQAQQQRRTGGAPWCCSSATTAAAAPKPTPSSQPFIPNPRAHADCPTPTRPKGYAFLELRTAEEASNAMAFDGVKFKDSNLKVGERGGCVGLRRGWTTAGSRSVAQCAE
jgi:cell division protein FtsN